MYVYTVTCTSSPCYKYRISLKKNFNVFCRTGVQDYDEQLFTVKKIEYDLLIKVFFTFLHTVR